MAINKNFVVKNGLEVNTNLLVADSDNTRVGVATTSPDYLLHVFGGIGATNLTVTGLSTLSGLSTFQSGFFVNGISTHIGVGTFQDNVFIEGQLFNSDTTENTLGDVDSGSVQLDGGLGVAKNTTIGAGLSVLGGLNVAGLSTFVGIVTTSSDLFVGGDLFISEDLVLDTNLNILGIATIGRLHVTGIGTIDGDARVGGALTVTSSVDFNDDLDVDGRTELDITNISETLNVTGISTFASTVNINSDLDVDGRTELDITNIAETLNVTGVSTFASAVDINADLDVDGHTELDNLKVSGISTFIGLSTFAAGVGIADSVFHLSDNTTSFRFPSDGTFTVEATGTERLRVNENGVNIVGLVTASSGGKFNQVDVGKSNINGITGDVNLTLDAGGGNGGAVIIASDVGLQASHNLIVSGITTLGIASATDFTADSVIVGSAVTINNTGVNITGVATVNSVVISGGGGLGIDLVTRNINASGVSTFVGFSTFNDSVFVQDNLSVGGITTSNSYTIDGTTVITSGRELQNIASLDATTTATIESAIANAPNTFTDLKVTGITTLGFTTATTIQVGNEGLSVTGVTTQTGDLIVGISTFFVDVSNGGVGVGTDNPNPQGFGPQFKVFGVNPVITLEDDGAGANAFGFIRQNNNSLEIVTGDANDNLIKIQKTSDTASTWGGSNITDVVTIDQNAITVGIGTATVRDSAKLDVDGGARFNGDVNFAGATGVTSAFFDKSDNSLKFQDNIKAKFGDGDDLEIYHDGSNSYIDNNTGNLTIDTLNDFYLRTSNGSQQQIYAETNGTVRLSHSGNAKFETDANGVKVTGIMTATGGYNLGIHSAGTEVTSPTGIITALDFVGTGNSICFKNQDTTSKVIEINIAGSGGGGGGGVTEVDTNVSSTSPTGVGSFAVASFRSAAVIAQIDQTGDYQVGRYLMIHDGTTVTVVEESAVSTGATMLGSFSGAIVGSNAELQVTMGNAGIATVTTKIDTVTV